MRVGSLLGSVEGLTLGEYEGIVVTDDGVFPITALGLEEGCELRCLLGFEVGCLLGCLVGIK